LELHKVHGILRNDACVDAELQTNEGYTFKEYDRKSPNSSLVIQCGTGEFSNVKV
jgi:hypothetical protein